MGTNKYKLFSLLFWLVYSTLLIIYYQNIGLNLLIISGIAPMLICWTFNWKYGILSLFLILVIALIRSGTSIQHPGSFLGINMIIGIILNLTGIVGISYLKNLYSKLKEIRNQLVLDNLKHETMISNIADVISIVDQHGIIRYKSSNVKDHFGWDASELIGKPAWETIHAEDKEYMQHEFIDLLTKPEESKTAEFRYLCKDNTWKTVHMFAKNLLNHSSIKGILVNYHDISEFDTTLKSLKKSEYKYRTLFENMQDIVCMLDKDGFITDINKAGCEFYEYSIAEMMKLKVSQLVYPEDKTKSDEYFNMLKKEGYYNMYEGRALTKTGKIKWIQVNSTEFLIDGEKSGSQDIIRDITERKEIENKLSEQNQALKESNAAKDKFFSIVSHDLKSPFNSIIGFAKLLYERYDSYSDGQKRELIEMIKVQSERTFRLLENLLEWSRLQRGKIQFMPIDFNIKDVIENEITLISQKAIERKITISTHFEVHSVLNADKEMISTIIRNLLANALKFTPEGGKITINIRELITKNTPETMEIEVIDSGVGISAENIQKLFRIDQNVKTIGLTGEKGTGLGLVLSKEFVEIHKGKISVQSVEGKGSTFSIKLPLKRMNKPIVLAN
ncbi:MAG: PAS domain S-box protein [Bacteroidales bacterium]